MLDSEQCGHPCKDYFNFGYCKCTSFEEYSETDEDEEDYSNKYYDWDDYDLEPEVCWNCGKDYEDFSDYGCCYCDVRLPCQE